MAGARLRDIADGRRDALNIDPRLIKIDEGFNPRQYTLFENRQHLDALKGSIKEMGVLVPLLVRWETGSEQAILIDGECRLRACLELIKEGTDIKTVPTLQEKGNNEVERLLLAITANTGKPLSLLESGTAYRRFIGHGWTPEEISRRSGIPLKSVKDALELSDAPEETKKMVSSGEVTPALAIKTVREKGSGATEELKGKVAEAKAKGKKTASRPKGAGVKTKAAAAKAVETDGLLKRGDRMAALIMAENPSWEDLEKAAKSWQKARG